MTNGLDPKQDTVPKLFSTESLASGIFEVNMCKLRMGAGQLGMNITMDVVS